MRYDSGQFGAFEGRDNRREVMRMLGLLRDDLHRARFLKGLLGGSRTGFGGKMMHVPACGQVDAYHYFIAITGCLGVGIEEAAKQLEREVRRA